MFVELVEEYHGRPAGERIHVADADAERLVQEGVAQSIADDPIAPLVTRALQPRLDSAVERAVQQALRKQGAAARPPFAGAGDAAVDDPKAGFKNFGEFALAVKDACQPGKRPDDRLAIIAKAAAGMGEAFGSDGGFLVPQEFTQKILERIYAPQHLLGMTDAYTIAGNTIAFPKNAETSRANGSRWGGVRAYWREEGDQATASKPTFGRLQLNLHKLFVMIHTSDELLADTQGLALEQYLLRVASEETNFVVGDSIINGTGGGQPQGILGAACTITVNKEAGQAAATLVAQNLVNMWARLWAPCRANAVWLINQDVESQLHSMTVGTGSAATLAYLPPGGLSAKPYATLLGRPVMPVEWCATLGTVGDVILADLRHYVTISRGMIDAQMSISFAVRFRRVDVPVHLPRGRSAVVVDAADAVQGSEHAVVLCRAANAVTAIANCRLQIADLRSGCFQFAICNLQFAILDLPFLRGRGKAFPPMGRSPWGRAFCPRLWNSYL